MNTSNQTYKKLATPFNNATLQPETVQNIFLSWIPGHSLLPSPGNQIEYVLSLWEVPTGMNPDNIVNSLQPLQSHTLTSASMVWGVQHAALVPGRQYVWRVQAQDPSNEVVFKNQGRSVPFTFTYGQACRTPLNLAHKDTDAFSSQISWQAFAGTENFLLEYKPTAEHGNNWRNQSVQGQSATLSNLAPTTSYTYRLSPQCGNFVGNATPERSFTTLAVPPLDIECVDGIVTPAAPDGTPLLTELSTGLMIWAAGFVVEVGAFERVDLNTFNGNGIMNIPFFNFALRADLKDIQVNHSLQLAGGTIEAIYGEELILIGGDNDPYGPQGPGGVDYSNPNDTLLVDGIITDIKPGDEEGTWIAITDDGEEITITPGDDTLLVLDEDGNGYVFTQDGFHPHKPDDEDGTGGTGGSGDQPGGGGEGSIDPQILCDHPIQFSPGGTLHHYGFDTYKENLPPGSYEQLQLGDDILHLHWKSVAQGGTDRLLASPATEGITFAWQSGIPIAATATQDGYNLQTGSPPAGTDLIMALCPAEEGEQAALSGAIAVQSYPITRHQLVVVPVGTSQPGFTRQQLQTTLNNIYAQAVVEWEVTFQDPLPLGGIDDLSQGITVPATDYSEHMRQVWRALVMNRNPVPGASYIFVIPGFDGNSGINGYMPLKSGYGFITPTTSPEVVAHELGHGAFNLRHTFSPHNVVNLPEGTTDNLMDYPSTSSGQVGTELWKYQWDFIHDPEGGWYLWEDVEEGAIVSKPTDFYIKINGDDYKYFDGDTILIAGKPILNISLYNKKDKLKEVKSWTYLEQSGEKTDSFSIEPQEYGGNEILEISFIRNLIQNTTLTFNFHYSEERLLLSGFGYFYPNDTIALYGEPNAMIMIDHFNQQAELFPHIKSWNWDGTVENSSLSEYTDLSIEKENQLYNLKVNYKHSSSHYLIKSLEAPFVSFRRSDMNNFIAKGSYGFDNYDYESFDSGNKFRGEYYISNSIANSYKTAWLSSRTGVNNFYLDATIPFKAENPIRYSVSWTDNDANFSIHKGHKDGLMELNFINSTNNFTRIEIRDKRDKLKGQIMIATRENASSRKNATSVIVKTTRGTTVVPSNFERQINQESFNQAFFEWVIDSDVKLLDMVTTVNTLTVEQEQLFSSDTLQGDNEIQSYRSLLISEYEKVNGIPYEDKPVVIFTDVVALGNEGRVRGQHITARTRDTGVTRYYIIYYEGALTCTWIHELGHNLGFKHTFEEGVTREQTKNFMDYGNNRYQFWKWQWFYINNMLEVDW